MFQQAFHQPIEFSLHSKLQAFIWLAVKLMLQDMDKRLGEPRILYVLLIY